MYCTLEFNLGRTTCKAAPSVGVSHPPRIRRDNRPLQPQRIPPRPPTPIRAPCHVKSLSNICAGQEFRTYPCPTCAGSITTWRLPIRADHASAVLVGSCAAKPSLVRGMPAAEDEGKDHLPLMVLLASEHGLLIPSSFFASVTASCKLRPRRVARTYMLALY